MGKTSQTIQVVVPKETFKRVEKRSKETGLSMSSLCRVIVIKAYGP